MKRKTILMILFSFLLVFILGLILYFVYNKEKNLSFYAEIKEMNNGSYIVSPLPNEELAKYDLISVNLNHEYSIGDIVIINAQNKILETYPVSMVVISHKLAKKEETTITTMPINDEESTLPQSEANSGPNNEEKDNQDIKEITMGENIITEEELLVEFNNYITEIDNTKPNNSLKEKAKNNFINIVDFIFYDKEISGYKFKNLTNQAKLKVISIALQLEDKINNLFPNYKNELSSSYQNAKNKLVTFYLEKTTEFCQKNDDVCNEAKSGFTQLKKSLSLSWSFIISMKDVGVKELQNWYEIFSGK